MYFISFFIFLIKNKESKPKIQSYSLESQKTIGANDVNTVIPWALYLKATMSSSANCKELV